MKNKSHTAADVEFLGDMPVEEFRKSGQDVLAWICNFLTNIDSIPVLPDIRPGGIKENLPEQAPQKSESVQAILGDLDDVIMPGMTHWNHPDFFAYFGISGSGPGILGEFLSAAFNVNGMLWKSCPSATELEQVTLSWLRQMLGLPEDFWGIIYDTASISSMHAIAAAREWLTDLKIREQGMCGRPGLPRLRLYASEQAHSSIDKAALALGIGLAGIRKIPVDEQFRMRPGELEKAIVEDKQQGWRPFCVVATLGTTSTTSVDPVAEIANICEKENLWLHVDAAYGGSAAVLPEMRATFTGWERADSIVMNPHKWLFVPVDLSAFYTRHPDVLKRAFSLEAEYLKTKEDSEVENYMDYGLQLGRRFRSLKLWLVVRYFGIEGIRRRIRYHIQLAQKLSSWIDAHTDFERMAPVPFSTVCFRVHPEGLNDLEKLNALNAQLLSAVNETRKIFLSHTKLRGQFVIRFAIGNLRTEERHIKNAWQLINEIFLEIYHAR